MPPVPRASSIEHEQVGSSIRSRRQTRFVSGPAEQQPSEQPQPSILKRSQSARRHSRRSSRGRRKSTVQFKLGFADRRSVGANTASGAEPCLWRPRGEDSERATCGYHDLGDDNLCYNNGTEASGSEQDGPIHRLALALASKWIQPRRFVLGLGGEDSLFDEPELKDCCQALGLGFNDAECAELFQAVAACAGVHGPGPAPTNSLLAALANTTTFRNGGVEFDAPVFQDDPIQRRRSTMRAATRASFAAPAASNLQRQKLIAIVAHNEMKPAMMAFVAAHIDFFQASRIVTTGSTGRALESGLGVNVDTKVSSGPLGGDQEIGGMIAQGTVGAVFFFRDPLSAHPHEADISALGRLCDVHDVLVATNPISGEAAVHALSTSALVMEQVTVDPVKEAAKLRQSMFDSAVVKAYKKRQEAAIKSAVSSAGKNNAQP